MVAPLVAHICFKCKKSFKRMPDGKNDLKCSDCGETAYQMSRNFKAPAKRDAKQWEKVEFLVRNGYRFGYVMERDGDPSVLLRPKTPDTLAEAKEFVKKYVSPTRRPDK